jgi:pantoate--beta-alanine ligase
MKIFHTNTDLHTWTEAAYNEGKQKGFVPTMGALHKGHLSLVELAKQENDIVVSSIFVNPLQFNNPSDLKNYPRTLDRDLQMLEASGCHAVFCPSQEEMYPQLPDKVYHFGLLDEVMEGLYRPGHFNGLQR